MLKQKEQLYSSLRGFYNEMHRGMPLDKRIEINQKMEEAIQEAHRVGVTEEDVAKIREEARGQSVRDEYEKDLEQGRKRREQGDA